jgi:hypothetical protein
MANRNTRFILKNNKDAAAPFSGATLYAGEPIVNTAAGIMMFSGVTSGTLGWTPAGDGAAGSGGNNNFFEVGSNLYNLKIRNKITSYSGETNLTGLFLSGTSNGFVLAPVSSIAGVDTYVTDFDYDDANKLTLTQNQAGQTFNVFINTMTGLTVSGTLSATTANIGTENVTTLNATGATITTSTVGTENVTTLNATGATITTSNVGTENVTTLNATGATITTLNSTTINGGTVNVNTLAVTAGTITTSATNPNDIVNLSKLTAYSQTNDVYVTGATYTPASDSSNATNWTLLYHGTPISGTYTLSGQNTYTTGGTYNNTQKEITFLRNDGSTGYTVDLSSIDVNDTFVTGGTITYTGRTGNIKLTRNDNVDVTLTNNLYDTYVTAFTYSNNTFTIKDNSGNTFSDTFNSVTGLTISTITDKQVVFAGPSNVLTGKTSFEFDYTTNKLTLPSNSSMYIGTGGLEIGANGSTGSTGTGDLIVHGSLTVFGQSISAFTSDLYIEDNNIYLNYNPSGSTASSSLGAGWTIQDGSGTQGTNAFFDVRGTGATTTERGFATNLNDIFIRESGTVNSPNGKRVLAEDDVLDGGTY